MKEITQKFNDESLQKEGEFDATLEKISANGVNMEPLAPGKM